MANKSKVVSYSSAVLTAGALGVALYVSGDKSLKLTDEQLAALQTALAPITSEVEGQEIVDSKGDVIAKFNSYVDEVNTKWQWTYTNANGNEITEKYYLGNASEDVTFQELKDAKGNVVGVYEAPTTGAEDGKLYLNGKWYDNISVNDKGQVQNGQDILGSIQEGKFDLKVDGQSVSGSIGESTTYQAVYKGNNIVGYQENNNEFPKDIFLFDSNGLNTNGIVSTRENLTKAKEVIVESVNGLNTDNTKISEDALKEYTSIIKGVDIKDYSSVSEYTKALQGAVEKEGTILNKLSAGVNEVSSSEIFDKVNEFLGANIADPASVGVIGLCAVGAIAVGGVTALATKAITGTDKKKIFGATSLNSSHGSSSKTR